MKAGVPATLNDILKKRTGASIISTWSDELPNIQAQGDEDPLMRIQRFVFQDFLRESEHGHSLLYYSGSAAKVITRPSKSIESVMVLEGTPLNSAIVLHITARFYQFSNFQTGRSKIRFEVHKVQGGHMTDISGGANSLVTP